MFFRLLRSAITPCVDAVRKCVDGKPEPRKPRDSVHIDCPEHGRTFLITTRLTACCSSRSWIHSGYVKSRKPGGVAAEVIFQ